MDPNLTDRQKEILIWMIETLFTQGYWPTLREIAANFKITPGAIQEHILRLNEKGFIERPKGYARAFILKRDPNTGYAVDRSWLLGRKNDV